MGHASMVAKPARTTNFAFAAHHWRPENPKVLTIVKHWTAPWFICGRTGALAGVRGGTLRQPLNLGRSLFAKVFRDALTNKTNSRSIVYYGKPRAGAAWRDRKVVSGRPGWTNTDPLANT